MTKYQERLWLKIMVNTDIVTLWFSHPKALCFIVCFTLNGTMMQEN